MATKNVSVNQSWTKIAAASDAEIFVSWDVPIILEIATTAADTAPTVNGHLFHKQEQVNRSKVGSGCVWARTASGSHPSEIVVFVSVGAQAGVMIDPATGLPTSPPNGTPSGPITDGLTDTQLRAAPVAVKQAGIVVSNSNGNNSVDQLSPGSSFVGSWEDVFSQPAAQILGGCDRPMRYTVEQAIDAAGANVISTTVYYRGANEDICENIQLNGNYVRVTAKNIGVAATTSFGLNTTLGALPALPQALTNAGNLRVAASETQNFTRKLRDNFQSYPNTNWSRVSKASGDLILLDGNTSGCSYLVMSLDPLTAGTETFIETDPVFNMPVELSAGLHTSQRTIGQEMSMSVVSPLETAAPPAEVKINSIQQATTTLTVNTTAAHNLRVGMRIGIYGVTQDSRLNYAALVVATTPSATQFTATAGPQGTISTLTVGPFSPAAAYVYLRDAVHGCNNGTSMILENAAATNASFYVKAEGGDATPIGGTFTGNHSAMTLTTASGQAVAAALNYAFRPISQFSLALLADRLQWSDVAVDTTSQPNNRGTITQVVPHPDSQYAVRFAIKNRKGLTIPVAKIVSAAKTGTTTATVVTDVAHNLTTGDYINTYGNRDQTNFANLTTATVVASVVNSTTFTVVWGAAVTATGYGGFVSRVQGQQTQQGAIAQVAQSYSVASGVMTVVGNTNWAGLSIGDYVNLHGCRLSGSAGADAGIDGTYRVRDFATTNLILEPIGSTPIPATVASTNIGGGVIKRTDLRLSFVRLFDFERLRVEPLQRPSGDQTSAFPVTVQNSPNISTVASVTSGNLGIPGAVVDVASATITATAATAAIIPTFGCSYEVNIPVTAVSGTLPTMDVVIQESDDSGANWFDVYHFPRITAMGMYRSPKLPLTGNRVRYMQTIGGSSPSFTRAINRVQASDSVSVLRQIYDRAVVNGTLNAVTASLVAQGARAVQLVLNMGAITTTAPQFQLEGSDDNGTTWYALGAPLVGVASSTVQVTVANVQTQMLRARVSTAGSGAPLGYALLKAF